MTIALPLGVTETFTFAAVPSGTYTFSVRATNAFGSSLAGARATPLPFRFAAGWFLLAPSLLFILVVRRYLLGLGGVER